MIENADQKYVMKHNKFCIMITCYKDTSVLTLQTLKAIGYEGDYRIIVGTDDPKLEEFKQKYGDKVYVFDKEAIRQEYNIDYMNAKSDITTKVILCARYACYKCAKEMGLDYYSQHDDDYASWSMRIPVGDQLKTYIYRSDFCKVKNIYERTLDNMIDILESNDHMTCISLAQAGDFIGGASAFYRIQGKRKVMNTMVFKMSNHKPIFRANLNEDVNLYLDEGRLGNICITYSGVMISQATTQNRKEGGVDAYREYGTYFKSYFSVMTNPSACKISILVSNKDVNYNRIHHNIDWNATCPKILSDKYKIK